MKTSKNLRFMLALGNQKVIVLQDRKETDIYTNAPCAQSNVSVGRLALAVSAK